MCHRHRNSLRFLRVGALAISVLVALVPAASAQSPTETVVLEYNHIHHMLADQDPVPLMRVYADGLVRVHYPVYMQRAGDYELKLSAAELATLFTSLESDGLMSLDVDRSVDERLRAVNDERSQGTLQYVSDVTETVIRVRGDVAAGGTLSVAPTEQFKTLRWKNLETDARAYPGVTAVQVLSASDDRLQQILDRPDLIKVR